MGVYPEYAYSATVSYGRWRRWWQDGCQEAVAVMEKMADKWGEAVAARGFASVPNYLMLINQFLDEEKQLSPIEQLVLIQLVGNWWKRDEPPFPAMRTLAARVGASERQVHRAIVRLEADGFLKRVKRKMKGVIASNAYDLSPLAEMLTSIAKQFPNAFPRQLNRDTAQMEEESTEPQQPANGETVAEVEPKPATRAKPRLRRLPQHRSS